MTRQDYINGNCTHRAYYAQFVTPAISAAIEKHIGLARIQRSTDPHFNDIPLCKWDALTQHINTKDFRDALKTHEDSYSLSSVVCVAKEAARQLAETFPKSITP